MMFCVHQQVEKDIIHNAQVLLLFVNHTETLYPEQSLVCSGVPNITSTQKKIGIFN